MPQVLPTTDNIPIIPIPQATVILPKPPVVINLPRVLPTKDDIPTVHRVPIVIDASKAGPAHVAVVKLNKPAQITPPQVNFGEAKTTFIDLQGVTPIKKAVVVELPNVGAMLQHP